MCRLLMLESPDGFDPAPQLSAFRALSRNSREFQGHGWGCAWLDTNGEWQLHHNIDPVWEDRREFPRTTLFLAHARSAFRDEGITVENNMPFSDSERVFLFNGELQGVRIRAQGRIGAEKIFNTIRRFDHGNIAEATRRGVALINRKTRYVRALNFFLADTREIQVCSQFGEDPGYFQMHSLEHRGMRIICSEAYDAGFGSWQPVPNNSVTTYTIG